MGTNFYMEKKCRCCGEKKSVHLGKSSAGWTFTFRGDLENGVVDYASWIVRVRTLLNAGYTLTNDNGSDVKTLNDLVQLIQEKYVEPNNQAKDYGYNDDNNWLDENGNSFTNNEFS